MQLTPLRDVSLDDTGSLATSAEPWLAVDGVAWAHLAGHYVELRYAASYWDEPARPILRFELASGAVIEHIGPAPVLGSAVWLGRVPPATRRLSISPTNRPGPFAFTVTSIRRRAWFGLLRQGIEQAPRPTRSAILTRLIGWRPESDNNLAWATGTHRLSGYAGWRRDRVRPLDLDGLDRPRSDWTAGPPIELWIAVEEPSAAFDRTLASILAQVFPNWVLRMVSPTALPLPDDPRILRAAGMDGLGDGAGLATRLVPGDELPPYALGCVHEIGLRHPAAQLFYGDEDLEDASGHVQPLFKPAWSPRLQANLPFLGRAVFVRLPQPDAALLSLVVKPAAGDAPALSALGDGAVVPIRRILLRTRERPPLQPRRAAPVPVAGASVALIVPTKDHAEDLGRLVASIRAVGDFERVRLVIIDNGSTAPDACALLRQLVAEDNVQVIDYPKPFNYSLMCNMGAAAARSDVLVFLNNDVEVLSAGWLDRLAAWALQPDVGAVGAKLTYPNGLIQHIGVVLGMGGSAGHFGSFALPDAPGWSGRHLAVHEVAAVTGACLAVAATKFEAVQGFDGVELPVELSDIDLCLKLAARGWPAIVDSHVHLMHKESASRGGATFRRLSRYGTERDIFLRRWRHLIRDDPYFHPGLSLFDREPALG